VSLATTIISRKRLLKAWGLTRDAHARALAAQVKLTGRMGPAARKLLAIFQTASHLSATGRWNMATLKALNGTAPKPFAPLRCLDYACGWHVGVGANLHQHGMHVVARYVAPGSANNWKRITAAEVKDLHAHGLKIVLVYETNASWMLGGRAAGRAAAMEALREAHAVGAPAHPVIYFACDFDANTHQTAAVIDCLRGCEDVLGKGNAGLYGGYGVIAVGAAAGFYHLWQSLAWSYGRWHPQSVFRQTSIWPQTPYGNLGVSYDADLQMRAEIGAW
jgi:hypothetical protein